MKRTKTAVLVLCCLLAVGCTSQTPIDRHAVVSRHDVVTTATDPKSPAQVGNGEFAFSMDITGLQTFVPFNTSSHWAWHSSPLPKGMDPADFKKTVIETHGRDVPYDVPNPAQPELSEWLAANPHSFNLGRLGFVLLKEDGAPASESDLENPRQRIDLWNGIVYSDFDLQGVPVAVRTACHPGLDAVGVDVKSPLVGMGRLKVSLQFPYPDAEAFREYPGRYDMPQAHLTAVVRQDEGSALLSRHLDDTHYNVSLAWSPPAKLLAEPQLHSFLLEPGSGDNLSITCLFAKPEPSAEEPAAPPAVEELLLASAEGWEQFWNSGAAIDLSGSTDPRWQELERRIVLSQYLMRANSAGSLPPQESALVNNGWYGRFHFEMIWWHGVHYALWDRWELFDKSLHIYRDFLPTSAQRAQEQGYQGARWPKCTGDFDREWPHIIHATLVWQQPHPIYFAELDYRLHPTPATLEKWQDVVFSTADFMADVVFDQNGRYILGPPLYLVSENSDPLVTSNPAFELGYWRWGLRTAQQWRERLGQTPDEKWAGVQARLAELPVQDSLYVTYEGIGDMWTKYAFEHPALVGTYGWLPGDGVDLPTFDRTLDKVVETWNFDHTWGWDFPVLAMAAARSGKPGLALDMLLHPAGGFQFDAHGLATGGPFPYFPSNGGLLTAVAMMAGGWDGSKGPHPGFPKDGTWKVRSEGFVPMP